MVRDRRGAVRDDARHELLVAAAQLLGLCALAVAQPLFDLLSDNAEFFVARGSRGLDVVVFTVALALGPPLVLFAAELLAGLAGRGARRALHLVFVAALVALLLLNALNDVERVPTGIQLLVAAYAGAAAAAAVWAFEPAATLVTFSAPAALLFAVLFVTSPGISAIFEPEASVRSAESARDVPVVMVVFDEFPPNLMLDAKRRIDARRFPNFARLARTSTWYSNATTVADETAEAVPAIVTGQYPDPDKPLPISSQHPDNLFTLLSRTHRLNVQEQITQLCPERLCRGNREGFGGRMRSIASDGWVVWRRLVLPPGLRRGLPDITTGWSGFGGSPAAAPATEDTVAAIHADRPARYGRFLASIDSDGGRPPLDYVHVLLPHVPWWYLPSGRAYGNGEYMPGLTADYRWTGGDGARFSAWQRMLLQARYVDRLLGELLRRLERTGMLDRSVVVVLADHGAAMRPGDFRRRFTAGTVGELGPVPLFIKAPGQHHGRTMTKHVRTLDVVPTIAALVGARLPWHTDGRSLAGGAYPEPTRLRFHRVFGGVDVVASVADARAPAFERAGRAAAAVRDGLAVPGPRRTRASRRPGRQAGRPGPRPPGRRGARRSEPRAVRERRSHRPRGSGIRDRRGPRPRRGRAQTGGRRGERARCRRGRELRPERRPGLRGDGPRRGLPARPKRRARRRRRLRRRAWPHARQTPSDVRPACEHTFVTYPTYVKDKARSLRADKHLSIDQIARRLALPKTTIYYWVRDLPLGRPRSSAGQRKGTRTMQRRYAVRRAAAVPTGPHRIQSAHGGTDVSRLRLPLHG